ncbi:hypothetical protein PLESTF_000714600 [Pleodorina starrii]|nr:hypothetical protein PLESTM_001803300 [Pleodorina starrii]GLC68617.1 hypothetical protein PLESTF_000714600 [Pleodorina starrii]
MAPTNRFIVQGRCSGLETPQLVQGSALIDADISALSGSFAAEPSLWRFNLRRQAGSTRRQNGFLLKSTGPLNVRDCSWTLSQTVWPPADRNGEAARSSSAASQPRACGSPSGLTVWTYPISAAGAALPSGHASGCGRVKSGPSSFPIADTTPTDGSAGSVLQRQALLQLVGPSTTSCHATGLSLIADAATSIAAALAPRPQAPALDPVAFPQLRPDSQPARGRQVSTCKEGSAGRDVTPSPADAWEQPIPLAQLHVACLASVTAALAHLPRVWSDQVPVLPGLFLRSWNPNARLGPGNPHPASQPLRQQQGGLAGPAAACPAVETAAAARAALAPPAACISSGRPKIGAPPPAALALAAAAAGAAAAGPSTDDSIGALYTVERAEGSCCSTSASTSADPGARFDSSSSNNSAGDGATGRWARFLGRRDAKRSGLPPQAEAQGGPAQSGQPAASGVAGLEKEEVEERAKAEAERQKVFDNPIRYCKLLFAGAMSAVVSRTCVAPLERVKMDLLLKNGTGDAFTTAAQVLRTEGIGGFWKGNALNVLRTAPFKAVNFFSFDMYRTALIALSGHETNVERFLAGACAGVTATLVCFPLDVVRTRLMASVAGPRYGSGPFSTLAGILRNEGAPALYSGCLPAVIGMAPAGAVFYGVYDMLKHQHLEKLAAEAGVAQGGKAAGETVVVAQQPATLDPVYTLLYGAMAGAASELIVYPLEVIRRKMQLQSMALASMRQLGGGGGMHPHHHHPNLFGPAGPASASAAAAAAGGRLAAAAHHHHHMLPYHLGAQRLMATLSAAAVANSPGLARVAAAVSAILSIDGPRGFYSGLLPNMLQVLPSAALSYYTYDTLKTVLGAR